MTARILTFPTPIRAEEDSRSVFRRACVALFSMALERRDDGLVSHEDVQALADALDAMLKPTGRAS